MPRWPLRAARFLLPSGVLALALVAPRPAAASSAPADVGPPPKLPDIGPPPSLPPTGGDLSSGAAPPAPSPSSPSPAKPTVKSPSAPPPGPPVMRPSARQVPPTPAPTAAPTPAPAPPPAAAPVPAPVSPAIPAPTSSPAPPSPEPVPAASPPPAADPALKAPSIDGGDPLPEEKKKEPAKTKEEEAEAEAKALRKQPKKWRHNGLILEPRIGLQGCTRVFCAGSQGHDAGPGVHLGGFVGGNIFGVLDVGIEVGWGTLKPRGAAGKNAVSLYGIDPERLEQAIADRTGADFLALDLSQLVVSSARTRTVQVGPALRIHFLRKGRGIAYVGAGIHYQQWRNQYETAGGPTRLSFHGLVAPLRVGGGAFVHPNIAITGEFAYHYAFFVVGGVSHTELSAVVPLTVIEGAALEAGSNLKQGMPHFWSFTVNLRFRLGG